MKRLTERCKEIGTGPIESANIKVTPVNNPLPQIVKHYTTIDSLSFEVIDFNNSVQGGQMAMLELIAKDCKGNYYPRGGCEVTVELESSVGEMITAEVTDHITMALHDLFSSSARWRNRAVSVCEWT